MFENRTAKSREGRTPYTLFPGQRTLRGEVFPKKDNFGEKSVRSERYDYFEILTIRNGNK